LFVVETDRRGNGASIPARLNLVLVAVFLGLSVFQLIILPATLIPLSPWWALTLIPCALATTTSWSLIHEAIHYLLMPDLRLNDTCGRVLAVCFGAPLASLRFPHLEHHRLNGSTSDRPEYFDETNTSWSVAASLYYPNLLLGIYAAEVAGTFACLTPRPVMRRIMRLFPEAHGYAARAETYFLQLARLRRIRFDASVVILLYGIAFWLYGRWWPLLALAIMARGVLISISDNSYHYGAPLGAGPRSAFNLKLPIGAGILNFNLHRVHHLHPTLPWTSLPRAFEDDGESYDVGYASAMMRQFNGPIPSNEYAASSYRPSNLGSRLA
jgi:fatty acid desaturase